MPTTATNDIRSIFFMPPPPASAVAGEDADIQRELALIELEEKFETRIADALESLTEITAALEAFHGPYNAKSRLICHVPISKASAALTAELKSLSTAELREQSDRYKALLEARDLEDVMFGAG